MEKLGGACWSARTEGRTSRTEYRRGGQARARRFSQCSSISPRDKQSSQLIMRLVIYSRTGLGISTSHHGAAVSLSLTRMHFPKRRAITRSACARPLSCPVQPGSWTKRGGLEIIPNATNRFESVRCRILSFRFPFLDTRKLWIVGRWTG